MRRHGPVDLMNDESLQDGDAVMTRAGIRIFVGDSSEHHKLTDFKKISEIKGLSKRERSALADLDTPGSNSYAKNGKPEIVTGRSVKDSSLAPGEMIIDPKGRSIRYVGP